MLRSITHFILLLIQVCVLFPVAAFADAISDTAPSPLLGIWAHQKTEQKTTLELTLTRNESGWTGTLDGNKIPIETIDDQIVISLRDGQRFKGKLTAQNQVEGTWYQPPSDYGFYSAMATRIALKKQDSGLWRAMVSLQPRPFHLFLDIFTDEDGKLKAALRNPERNDILGATLFDVTYNPNALLGPNGLLWAKRGSRKIEVPFNYDAAAGITLEHFAIPEPVALKKAQRTQLHRYYSRLPSASPLTLSPVRQLQDGWETTTPSEAGFDSDILLALLKKLATSDPRETRPQLLHSLLVSYQGKLVFEEYFYGHTAQQVHDTRSMAKVFGSILIGAAKQQGISISPDYLPLPDILGKHKKRVSPSQSAIALHHLLTYTSGLDTSEDADSKGSEDALWRQEKRDFWLYTAELPVLHPPGTRYAYSSASANMVGAAIEHFTKADVRNVFDRFIAKPLQLGPYHWNLTPQGTSYLGGGVYMRPRDILKLGALYASGGMWQQTRIIPEDWINTSTSPHVPISPATTGMTQQQFNNHYFGGHQAYIWRVDSVSNGTKTYVSYEATGNGGQTLVVVPSLELAVVTTGGNYRMGFIWGKWRQQIIGDYLIPALTRREDRMRHAQD